MLFGQLCRCRVFFVEVVSCVKYHLTHDTHTLPLSLFFSLTHSHILKDRYRGVVWAVVEVVVEQVRTVVGGRGDKLCLWWEQKAVWELQCLVVSE